MKMIFIFIDGFGLGEADADKNPIYAADAPNIRKLLQSRTMMYPVDACLGVPGLPQSATGQTTIYTGVNASKALGRHLHGQPTITLKNIINRGNLFKELRARGYKTVNSNAYRSEYLDNMLLQKDRRLRPSVTSVMTLSCGMTFNTVKDFKAGNGMYHDITGKMLRERGEDVEVISPGEAARRLYSLTAKYDFVLFEHFMTDIIGHSMDMKQAVDEINLLDEFLGELLEVADPDECIIFITSDHGNIEDITVKTHTRNAVPVIIIGNIPGGSIHELRDLTDIMPAVLSLFDWQSRQND